MNPQTKQQPSDDRRARLSDLVVELSLFWCSYAPLFAIFAIRFQTRGLEVGCGLLSVGGVAAGVAVLGRYRKVSARSWTVRDAQDRGSEVAGYLASYLLPLIAVAQPGWRDVLAYLLFLAIVAVLYVRSGLIQINPTLYLLGWRLFAIGLGEDWHGYLLARCAPTPGAHLHGVRISERVFITYDKAQKQ
jgi:hypothetical protein